MAAFPVTGEPLFFLLLQMLLSWLLINITGYDSGCRNRPSCVV